MLKPVLVNHKFVFRIYSGNYKVCDHNSMQIYIFFTFCREKCCYFIDRMNSAILAELLKTETLQDSERTLKLLDQVDR